MKLTLEAYNQHFRAVSGRGYIIPLPDKKALEMRKMRGKAVQLGGNSAQPEKDKWHERLVQTKGRKDLYMNMKEAIRILEETKLCSPLSQAAFAVIEAIKELAAYQKLGTVDEFRALKEKEFKHKVRDMHIGFIDLMQQNIEAITKMYVPKPEGGDGE